MFYRNKLLDFEMNHIYHLFPAHHCTDRKQKKGNTSGKSSRPVNSAARAGSRIRHIVEQLLILAALLFTNG